MRLRERYHSVIGLLREINIQLAMVKKQHDAQYFSPSGAPRCYSISVTLWSAGLGAAMFTENCNSDPN
jgi:hypothetical protein